MTVTNIWNYLNIFFLTFILLWHFCLLLIFNLNFKLYLNIFFLNFILLLHYWLYKVKKTVYYIGVKREYTISEKRTAFESTFVNEDDSDFEIRSYYRHNSELHVLDYWLKLVIIVRHYSGLRPVLMSDYLFLSILQILHTA